MALMTPRQIPRLADLTARQWHARSVKWELMEEVVLLDEVQDLLIVAVCR